MNGSFARAGLKHRESFTYQNPGMALAAIELIDDVIQITSEGHVILEQLMDTVLGIFSASRAWLFYPCNPNLTSFEVSFESTAPEYPGAKALAQKVPMTDDMADYCRRALSAKNGPEIDPPEGTPVKNDIAIRFDVKSMLFMALRPKSGEPWMFGLHQCDRDRIWTDDEKQLFYMIGQRTSGCIDHLLYVRQLQESEERFRAIFENINDAVFIHKILSNGEPGNFLLFNRAAKKMTGYSAEELRSMSPRELDDPDASSQYIPGVMAQLKTRKSATFEAVQRAKDGRKIDIEVNAVVADIGGQDFIVSVCRDITEKKAFQKELLEKEQFLSAIYKGVSHSIFVVDVLDDGGFKYAGLNPQHEKITGVSDDFIQGKTPEEVLPKGNALAVCRRYADCVNRKQILKYEEWLPFKGKQTCWETTLHPQMSSSGQVYRIIGTSQEITERKTAETLLERVRYSIDKVSDTILWVDENGQFIDANEGACQNLGYDYEALITKGVADIDPYFPQERWPSHWEEMTQCGKMIIESVHQTKNGNRYPVEIILHNQQFQDKRYNCVFARDITDRRQAEQERLESKQKYQSMVENVGIGVSLLSKNMEIVELNKQMRRWFPKVDPATRPICYKAFNEPPSDTICDWCQTYKTLQDGKVYETITSTPVAGGVRNFRVVSSPILDSAGNVKAAIEMVEDVTEKLKSEEHVRQTQKMESIGNLAGGIAHDFNNILFPIIGMAELLLEDLPPNSLEFENAEEILKAGKRGRSLVQQILAFSRRTDQEMLPVRIQKVLQEVLRLVRSTLPANIEIRQHIQDNCGMIRADPTQIHQIAVNLITNAYHAVQPCNGEITVALNETLLENGHLPTRDLQPRRYAVLTIADTGSGIDPQVKNRIFEPYFTTKEKGKGTGLGLAVVHGIVSDHGGSIAVDSRVGVGTAFRVYFPLIADRTRQSSSEALETHPTGTERVLLVDDEASIVRLLKQTLERLGYHVTALTSSLEALQSFKTAPADFDVVVSDMTMPCMTGDQLAAALMEIRPDIPIIICTGFSERINQERAAAIGVKGFLIKPIVKSEMAKTIRNVLDERIGSMKS